MRLSSSTVKPVGLSDRRLVAWPQHDIAGIDAAYNRYLGPILRVTIHRPDVYDYPIYTSICALSSLRTLLPDATMRMPHMDDFMLPAGGKGATMLEAVQGGIGEGIERLLGAVTYASMRSSIVRASYGRLKRAGTRALGPTELPLFADEQYRRPGFPYIPFDSDVELGWVEGTELPSGRPVLVPAQIALLYYSRPTWEPPIGYATTGGLAFATTAARAAAHGMCEIVERDAVNIRWHCRMPPPRVLVDWTDLTTSVGSRIPPGTPSLPEPLVLHSTIDIPIPVFTALSADVTLHERALVAGGGASLDVRTAILKAYFELGQTRTALRFLPEAGISVHADSDATDLTDFFDAVVYYGYRQNLTKLSWYTGSDERVEWSDLVSESRSGLFDDALEYREVVDRLTRAGCTPIAVALDDGLQSGFITKVIIPQLTQAGTPGAPFLGHPRFRLFVPRDESGNGIHLNEDPVPFP